MNQVYLETPEDLEWLRETHLLGCIVPDFAIAIIDGTEDYPEKITLYEVNHVNSITMELWPNEDGDFFVNKPRY